MAMEVMSKIRRFAIGKAGLSPIVVRSTGVESLAVAQVESDGQEMTRAGRRFMLGRSAAVTGLAPAVTQVVTAQWSIWNADSTKSYVFDHIGAVLVSGTAAVTIEVMASIFTSTSTAAITTGAGIAGMKVQNCSNGSNNSKAIIGNNGGTLITITTPSAPWWTPVAENNTANTAVLSVATTNYDLRGQIIVPPGQGLGINVYSAVGTTALYAPMAMWTEIELDLE